MSYSIEPSDLVLGYSPERVFPFIEHDGGDITGYGHQDKQTFADAVNTYDRVSGDGFSDGWQADDVTHAWAVGDAYRLALLGADDGEIVLCSGGEPRAIPVTTLWGKR